MTNHQEPLEDSLLHRLLVNTDRLQSLPIPAVLLSLVFDAAIVAIAWRSGSSDQWILAVIIYVVAVMLAWVLLLGLRKTGRSFGPDRPTVLVLGMLYALLMTLCGVFAVPVWLPALLLLLGTLLIIYSTWIEPFRLGVTQQQYHSSKWNSDAPPLRVLQIGDIHLERITERERMLNRRIQQLAPDVILYTGDFVNLSNTHDPESERHIREIIAAWAAPQGVYVVSGTPLVEPAERVEAFTAGLDNLKWLRNQWVTLQTAGGALNILGLSVTHDMEKDHTLLKKAMLNAPKKGLHLLLMHPPDIAPEANEAGIDLYFCGHTHGGQIRLPFIGAIFSSSHLGKRFIMGRYELGTTTLYTSRGVGLEGLGAPRARFLCPPEIVLWEISGA